MEDESLGADVVGEKVNSFYFIVISMQCDLDAIAQCSFGPGQRVAG
jgi:hypothetical protein